MNFNFTHFAKFNIAHFEVEVSLWLTWVNLTKWPISLANFHFRYLKGARFKYKLYFCSFCV